ncbi:hypothetical protein Tco_0005184 [Tanacetum coccineum]
MSDLYDVKISVRSSVKLLPEIKGILSIKPKRERLFRDTVFGPWLDIQSHENDSHMMHYVLQHQIFVTNIRSDCPLIIFHIVLRDRKTWLNMWDEDAVRLCLLIAGEYMWEKFYQRTVNVVSRHTEHHLAELKKNLNFNATYNLYRFAWAFKLSIPNVALILSPKEMRQAWFMASVEFIQGLAHQDGNFLQDDEARGKCIEHYNGMCGDTEDGDGVHLSQTNDVIQQAVNLSTMLSTSPQARNAVVAEFFAEFYALKKQLLLIKKRKDDEFDELTKRFKSEEIPNFCSDHNDTSNHIGGVSTKAKHHLHLFIKALDSKTENPTIDVVVPPIDDDRILRTIKPNDACDEVEVLDNFEDNYMLMLNDEEKPVKSSLNDMELEQEHEKIAVKQGILEQQPNAAKGKNNYWAIVSPHFSTSILSGIMPDYFSNVHMYPLPWIAVEKCLVELEIRNGVVTFYDSLGWAGGSRRRWWRQMKKLLPEKLTVYLLMHGIFESNGISADDYKITYKYVAAPFQASLFGDCGIWVLERISKKRTKNEAKTTKPGTEWKSVEKTKSRQSPSLKKSQPKSTPTNPKSNPRLQVKKNKFRD